MDEVFTSTSFDTSSVNSVATFPSRGRLYRGRRSPCGSVTLGDKHRTVVFIKTLTPLRYLDDPLCNAYPFAETVGASPHPTNKGIHPTRRVDSRINRLCLAHWERCAPCVTERGSPLHRIFLCGDGPSRTPVPTSVETCQNVGLIHKSTAYASPSGRGVALCVTERGSHGDAPTI